MDVYHHNAKEQLTTENIAWVKKATEAEKFGTVKIAFCDYGHGNQILVWLKLQGHLESANLHQGQESTLL